MRKNLFETCIPTRGTKVPHHSDWIHEVKHGGYRLIIQRDGDRVRLFNRNGYDWSDRYPLITEAVPSTSGHPMMRGAMQADNSGVVLT
jgi:bifunctional non-homologous end joining protein LigD